MRKYILSVLTTICCISCTSIPTPKFVNMFEPELNRQYMVEKIKILSIAGDLFKVYALTENRVAIVEPLPNPYESFYGTTDRSTSTVDIIDLKKSIILNNDQHNDLKEHLRNIINILNEPYKKGIGTLYDYSIFYETSVTTKTEILRIQLRLDDKDSRSSDPYIKITVKLLGFIGEIKQNDLERLFAVL
jgi:hypothetical protein